MSRGGTPALALAALLAGACRSAGDSPPEERVVFHGGRIYLGHPEWRTVDALLAVGGVVRVAGTEAEVLAAAGPSARRVDLGGGTAVPGLQDAHGHLLSLGASLENVDLTRARSYEELIELVAARAARTVPGRWIEGRGWDQTRWSGGEFPHHRELSERVPGHPLFLKRVDGHAALVNSAALREAGLEGALEREDLAEGGRVLLDPDRRATGVLVDRAMDLVERRIPEPDDETLRARLLAAQESVLALGLTAVHDMGLTTRAVRVLHDLRAEGRLELRVVGYLAGTSGIETDGGAEELRGLALGVTGDERLCIAGVKLYADGALGSRGAALLADYADEPGHRGLLLTPEPELARQIALCAGRGLQPAIHAIGDRANRLVLDLYAEVIARHAGFAELRPRIEHAQVVAREDWGRFAALGVVPSMQPTHATSDMRWAEQRLGTDRLAGAYAWRRLAPDPDLLALGSDFPVESASPLAGLYAARTRQDAQGSPAGGFLPDQRLSAREALNGFTWGAARAARQEERRGRLARGCAADLTVLDVDPLECEPAELLRARVLFTVIDGAVARQAPAR